MSSSLPAHVHGLAAGMTWLPVASLSTTAKHVGHLFNYLIELLISLALAMSHGELRVDEHAVSSHLKGAALATILASASVDASIDSDFVSKCLFQKGLQRMSELGVASAASVFYTDWK